MRAVTFQSMLRTSSPAWYSRTSANSIPCPLNPERYSPVKSEFTSPRVRSSSNLTWRSTSGGTAGDVGDGRWTTGDGRSAPRSVGRLRRKNPNMGLTVDRSSPVVHRPLRSRTLDLGQHARHDVVARHVLGLRLV